MKINPNYIRVLDSSNESKIAYTRNDPSNKSMNYKLFKNTVIFMLEKKYTMNYQSLGSQLYRH